MLQKHKVADVIHHVINSNRKPHGTWELGILRGSVEYGTEYYKVLRINGKTPLLLYVYTYSIGCALLLKSCWMTVGRHIMIV
jgi:hypothetical protein